MPIFSRRSIRKFSDKPVLRELIEEIILAGIVSPSAKNRQPWRYIVFGGEAKAELLAHMERGIEREASEAARLPNSRRGIPDAEYTLKVMKQAPVIIIVLNENGGSPFAEINADDRITEMCDLLSIGASIENMLLRATELGLGTLWIANTCYAYDELTAFLGTDSQLTGAIALGYAEESPAQRPRKSLDEVSEFRL